MSGITRRCRPTWGASILGSCERRRYHCLVQPSRQLPHAAERPTVSQHSATLKMEPVYVGGARGYLIDGTLYRSKKALVEAVRAVLHAYEPGASVSDPHFNFLLDLLSYHPEAEEKIGSGVVAFEVRAVPGYEHVSGFWAIRNDGSEVAWSYTKVISPPKPFALFRKVCRATVADQICEFRAEWFRAHAKSGHFVCAVTGEEVPAERAHVDHEPPLTLDALVRAFVAERGIDVREVALPETEDTGIGYYFADAALAEDWRAYHQLHAKLRIISDTANLSDVKKAAARRAG